MRSYEFHIDVTGRVDLDGALRTAATVYLPDLVDGPLKVLVGYPGGGYSRHYYNIRQATGYSQAEHHTDRGFGFIACDHLGIGDSVPVDAFDLTLERMAAANHATASSAVERLRAGSLIDGVGPIEVEKLVGMGQSMGGCLLTVQQGLHGTFDAIAVLGYGVVRSGFPTPDGQRINFPAPPRDSNLRAFADRPLAAVAEHAALLRYAFHAADDETGLVEADMPISPGTPGGHRLPPWRVDAAPPCAASMMADGAVAKEAAAIETPVLIGCGEIDLVADPWSEPSAFRGSSDVALFVVPRMAHMHNFAATRALLWDRIDRFAEGTIRAPSTASTRGRI